MQSGASDGGGGPGGSDGRGGSATGQWVLGYYVGYDIDAYPIASIDWAGLSHIAFAPMTVGADLRPDLGFSDQHGTGTADAMALAAPPTATAWCR